jgi:hypothetical protein
MTAVIIIIFLIGHVDFLVVTVEIGFRQFQLVWME